jgi:hypothetical protein
VDGNGNVLADGTYSGPADFAELMKVSTGAKSVEPGDVMVIDVASSRSLVRSGAPRSTLVAGVYSTRPGFVGSEHDWDEVNASIMAASTASDGEPIEMPAEDVLTMGARLGEVPLAVVGIVPCKVSAENGPIQPGDLLVTSATPGHAMRDEDPRMGTVIGKALEPLSSGTGVIRVLVTLQ